MSRGRVRDGHGHDAWAPGYACLRAGRAGTRQRYLREALTLRLERDDRYGIPIQLTDLAYVAAARGEPERATRLEAAASAIRRATGAEIDDVNRADYDRMIAGLRVALGNDRFDKLWTASLALTPEQAIAVAREAVGDTPPAAPTAPDRAPIPVGPTWREHDVLRQLAERRTVETHVGNVSAELDFSLATPTESLPRPLTSLIGRERELADGRCSAAPGRRPAGDPDRSRRGGQDPAGARGGDARWSAQLPGRGLVRRSGAAPRSGALVVPAIAQAIGIARPARIRSGAARRMPAATSALLLVLDNFEHVVDAAPADRSSCWRLPAPDGAGHQPGAAAASRGEHEYPVAAAARLAPMRRPHPATTAARSTRCGSSSSAPRRCSPTSR